MFGRQRYLSSAVLVIAIVGVMLATAVQPVSACSCIMPGPPNEGFEQAHAVFSGKVTAISGGTNILSGLMELAGLGGSGIYGRLVTFAVTDSWKGVETAEVKVRTGIGGGDCGYPFDVGSEYLVYGFEDGSRLTAHICSRTTAVSASSAADDFTFLAGKPTLTLSKVDSATRSVGWLIALVGVVGGGFVAILFFRRRKANSEPD